MLQYMCFSFKNFVPRPVPSQCSGQNSLQILLTKKLIWLLKYWVYYCWRNNYYTNINPLTWTAFLYYNISISRSQFLNHDLCLGTTVLISGKIVYKHFRTINSCYKHKNKYDNPNQKIIFNHNWRHKHKLFTITAFLWYNICLCHSQFLNHELQQKYDTNMLPANANSINCLKHATKPPSFLNICGTKILSQLSIYVKISNKF